MVMAMEMLWSLYVLVVLFSLHPAHSQKSLQGLSCLNDYVNNISCTWNGSPVGPGVDCWIVGIKKTLKFYKGDAVRHVSQMIRSCKLKERRDSPPGCSFVFENKEFSCLEVMPSIHMECNGTLVGNLTNYKPCDHIKMHPPSVPNVSTNANETRIFWTPGSPRSRFFISFEFKVQIKQNHQQWREAITLSAQEQVIRIPAWRVKGHHQVRVQVKPPKNLYPNTLWSNWSPTTSWVGATDNQVRPLHRMPWLVLGGLSLLTLFSAVLVALLRTCWSRGLLKGKPVPDPSKYFHTLHSVHGGNLKKWLNHQSACESFFAAQAHDHISPVEVCDHWDAAPATSPCSSSTSTSALLHSHPYCPPAGSDTSGVVCHSSCSSCFSNMGYFISSYSSSPARPGGWKSDYFAYQDDFKAPHNSHGLHLSLCPSFATSPTYECLKKEPQSPDSGFGIEKEEEEEKEDEKHKDAEGEGVSSDHPLLILTLHLPSRMGPPSSSPPLLSSSPPLPSHPPSLTQVCSDNQDPDEPVAAPSSSYAAWPVDATMCRSSSMPVEPCKTGYLTLKELQTTFSNKSI